MSPDPHGWPFAARPGVPLNPERDGWHWLCAAVGIAAPYPMLWSHDGKAWDTGDGWEFCTAPRMTERTRYLGPALLPAEVAAREAAAAEAMRDIAAETAREACLVPPDGGSPNADEVEVCDEAERRIRALPLPAADALARALEQARAEEREACARIAVERGAWASNDADAESLVDRLEARGRMDAASEIAAAIRERGKEKMEDG